MAKYKLKALNVVIGGVLYKKEQDFIFDTEKMKSLAPQIEKACEKGYLEKVEEKKSTKKDK